MDISYRERTREDRKGVIRLAISAFGVAVRPFFSLGEAGHVAESNGRIVGATVLKTFTVGGRRFGEVGWIMVARDARGQGIAGRLYHLAEEWFRARQVTDLVAIIEGYNQSSSKLFAGNGFERISLRKQLEQFGLAAPVVRFKTTLFMAFGHYLWHRSLNAATDNAMDSATEDAKPEVDSGHGEAAGASPVTSWLSAWVLHAFIMAILLVRWGVGGPLNMRVIAVVVTPALLLGVRWAAFAAAARGFGLHLRYRAWDGGMGLALLISAVFGGFISVPGSHYPVQESYRYRDVIGRLGPVSLVAALIQLVVACGVWLLLRSEAPLGVVGLSVAAFLVVVRLHLLFDVATAFFPFWGFAGIQIRAWNVAAWVACAVAVVAFFVLSTFFI